MRLKIFCCILLTTIWGCHTQQPENSNYQIFRYNESKGVPTLDPAFARNLAVIWPIHQLYNGLVQLDDSLRVIPCIAKSWSISPAGTVYTFTIRNDVFFHDSEVFPEGKGRKATAFDFEYSFKRIVDPSTASPGAWIFSSVLKIDNGYAFKALNDSTIQIELQKPFPPFLNLLTTPYCSVIPHEAVLKYGKDFRSKPVGTGPFYLKLWREGEKLVLRKNTKYFEFDNKRHRLPYLDAITITFVADKQSEFLEFIKGNIDFISGLHPASKDELLTRTGAMNPKYVSRIKMLTGPYLNTEYLGILVDSSLQICQNNPLKNPLVRKAFGYGIDRKKMMIYLRSNMGYPADKGFVPAGMPNYSSINNGFDYRPELTKDLLSKAGYHEGKGLLPITISTTDDYLDICEFIQHQLNELGFQVNVEVFPGAAYREMMANSKLMVFRGSWVADYADPENYLALFYSQNFSPSGPNYTHFRNMEFDQLYNESIRENNITRRNLIYQMMDSMVISNAVVIPLYYDKVVRFVSKEVNGMATNPMNLLDLKTVYKRNEL